jgi:hypothetical protein
LGEEKFSGIGDGKRLAFACSLTAENRLPGNVRGDVTTIMEGTLKPPVVYFFAGAPLAIAKGHELQTWAHEQHDIELEILDAPALADQLSSPELFWIAVRYFNVSPEVFPPTEADDSYQAAKEKWFAAQLGLVNFADFVEVKRAARKSWMISYQTCHVVLTS